MRNFFTTVDVTEIIAIKLKISSQFCLWKGEIVRSNRVKRRYAHAGKKARKRGQGRVKKRKSCKPWRCVLGVKLMLCANLWRRLYETARYGVGFVLADLILELA